MSDAVIVRRKVKSNFTVLDNAIFRDTRMSWKALGLLSWLLSLPPNFKLRLSYLASLRPTGRDATRSGLKELEDCGYLIIVRERDPTGRFTTTTWNVSDCPTDSPISENPNVEKPSLEKSVSENTTLTNTTKSKELSKQTTTRTGPNTIMGRNDCVGLEADAIRAAVRHLSPQLQQDILDEVEGKRRAGRLRSSAIALAKYLAANVDKFVLADGVDVKRERAEKRSTEARVRRLEQGRESEGRQISESLVEMSDETFEELHRMLPAAIKARVSKHRLNLLAKENSQ